MKLNHIILCTVFLLVAGIGYASADPGAGSRKKVRESSEVRLLADKKRNSDGRISIRCTVARCDTATVLQARILKGNTAVQVVRPGYALCCKTANPLYSPPNTNQPAATTGRPDAGTTSRSGSPDPTPGC